MGDREGKRADKYLHLVTPPELFVGPQKDESEMKAKIGKDVADRHSYQCGYRLFDLLR
jgi:hypothetical protein